MYDEEEVGMSFLKLNDILSGNQSLTDKYDIEPVLSAMSQMEKKVEFLKELKKRRASLIDEQIAAEEANIEKLCDAIKNCMALNKAKTLDFPGVGKVSIRKTKGTWTVVDENGLRSHLESLNKFDDVSEETWRFKKKELNKVLDELEANNNASDHVKRESEKESLSISYAKDNSSDVPVAAPVAAPVAVPVAVPVARPSPVKSSDSLVI